uniref:Uncharacterized protein n=1 Tax=Steinernema glaseri TaxID=37863 RepID=A0A1I7ZHE6_9BILA
MCPLARERHRQHEEHNQPTDRHHVDRSRDRGGQLTDGRRLVRSLQKETVSVSYLHFVIRCWPCVLPEDCIFFVCSPVEEG